MRNSPRCSTACSAWRPPGPRWRSRSPRPARHDLLGQVGPGQRRRRDAREHLLITWVMRSSDPARSPLERLTTGIHGWMVVGRLQGGRAVRRHPDDQHLGLGDSLVRARPWPSGEAGGEAGRVAVVRALVVDLVRDLLVAGHSTVRCRPRRRGHRHVPRTCSQHHKRACPSPGSVKPQCARGRSPRRAGAGRRPEWPARTRGRAAAGPTRPRRVRRSGCPPVARRS